MAPRRGGRFWQQLKGRFRRDGKADRNGDVRAEASEEGEKRRTRGTAQARLMQVRRRVAAAGRQLIAPYS